MKGITKTYLYNFNPLEPHFYIVKLGFTGVYIFLISAKNIDWRGGSNEYPQSMFSEYEKYQKFYLKTFVFLVVKISIYLNRRVFVMERHFMSYTNNDDPLILQIATLTRTLSWSFGIFYRRHWIGNKEGNWIPRQTARKCRLIWT